MWLSEMASGSIVDQSSVFLITRHTNLLQELKGVDSELPTRLPSSNRDQANMAGWKEKPTAHQQPEENRLKLARQSHVMTLFAK